MSKYSLQTECLENIEAFSDEQFNAEMAVIESAMEIFDKSIFMMELAADSDIIPDCPIFMESFIQEVDNVANGESSANGSQAPTDNGGNNQAPAATGNNNTSTNNNGDSKANENKPMTDAERKAYNKEHWVRQTNKNGKVENIFISIIAFIPRFFMFLGRCVKKLFTKTSDKSKDEAVKKADENMQNMTNDQIAQAVNSVKPEAEQQPESEQQANNTTSQQENQPAQPQQQHQKNETVDNIGSFDPTSHTWNWYNTENVLTGIRKCMETLTNISNNVDSYLDKSTNDLKTQIDNCQTIIKSALSPEKSIQMRGTEAAASKESIKNELGKFGTLCENLAKTFESKKDVFLKVFERNTDKNTKINEVKQSCEALKVFSKTTAGMLDKVYKAYEKLVRDAFAINNAAGNNTQQQVQGQPQGGGNPNGGQNQNNQSNTG